MRSSLENPANDLVRDAGAVLWSIVQGEQLEFEMDLAFINNPLECLYEAVVIEAANMPEQTSAPQMVELNGAQTVLGVRIPVNTGEWVPLRFYSYEQRVTHLGRCYRLIRGVAYGSAVPPKDDPNWEEVSAGLVYLQFPESLARNWKVKPSVNAAVYGFVEVRVTEPPNAVYQRTWKPVRGMVQIHFSPTEAHPG